MRKEKILQQPSNGQRDPAHLPLDLTFLVNEPGKTLRNRFEQLIKDCSFFDCLVAYFFVSGFNAIYQPLQNTKRIRILIGVATNLTTYDLIKSAASSPPQSFKFSHIETKQHIERIIEEEMAESPDSPNVEEGIRKFVEWIKEGKLQIRAYPSQNLHAKLYIMTFREGDRDVGRVITGSSNFTQSGLEDNLEFNVELKNCSDFEFARQKFEELWKNAVDVSEKYIQTLYDRTWLNPNITPYELYLKFLYEYFKDELSRRDEVFTRYLPQDFKRFEYQEQAVLNARKILEEYGGVFISDVVGLGKTYVATLLAGQLDGRTLVIAPPALISENNPGSWCNVIRDFHIPAKCCSIGKLDEAIKYIERYEASDTPVKNIILDEAHRFRTETTISYEIVAEICRGKRVILVSATPYNNSPRDILAQIKLFQNVRRSTIPGVPDLEEFFGRLEAKLNNIDRHQNYDRFLEIAKSNAKEIRDKVLKYIMVRRTRAEIEKYFAEDLKRNNVKFPEVEDPKPFYYQLNDDEDRVFMQTIELLTQKLTYARYTPLLYLKEDISQLEEQAQKNMGGFMKVLLVKRLESSFYAFRKSIDRFIYSYEMFLREYEKGNVYISKGYINKIFELIDQGDDEAIQQLIEQGKAKKYKSSDFKPELGKDLRNDLEVLKQIKLMWQSIKRDPKLQTLLKNLEIHPLLKDKKTIIFTESRETAEYLQANINDKFGEIALLFHGSSPEEIRDKVIENFDARARSKKDDYRILVSTEVLSEGVNLHRSNIVINYDIPWNPTRLMQRVGRINRIDTPFDRIYTFNFFPTKQADSEIELTNIARSKIEAFLTLLGGDSAILTEGEPVTSHELFDRLLSKKAITEEEEEESELKYLRIIEDIRDQNPELFEKIKRLPKKARSAKLFGEKIKDIASPHSLITFFRKGKLTKFFLSRVTQASGLSCNVTQASGLNDLHKRDACDTASGLSCNVSQTSGLNDLHKRDACDTTSGLSHSVTQASGLNDLQKRDACDTPVTQASGLSSNVASGFNSAFHKRDACTTEIHKPETCDTLSGLSPDIYFDPYEQLSVHTRNLPHWWQPGKAYFVTFRLYDSIPQKIAEQIKAEREEWLKENKIDRHNIKNLPKEKQTEYYKLFSKRYDELLDNGYGSCLLQDESCKKIVEDALLYFNNQRYILDKYVIMPNHVHVIVVPISEWDLSQILHSWKSFTAHKINAVLNRKGDVWMYESFDHIIRSPEQLESIRKYIEDNPKMLSFHKRDACDTPVTQASGLSDLHKRDACDTASGLSHNVSQASGLSDLHKRDACDTIELDFLTAAKILESSADEKREKLPLETYYELLGKNKTAFYNATIEELIETKRKGGSDSATRLLKILRATQKNSKQLTEEQEEYLRQIIHRLESGALPKKTVQKTLRSIQKLGLAEIQNPLKVLAVLGQEISPAFLKSHYAEVSAIPEGKREVILSLYITE